VEVSLESLDRHIPHHLLGLFLILDGEIIDLNSFVPGF